jgi:hypothetical protein
MNKLLKDLMEKKAAKEQVDEPASPDESGMAMDQANFIGYVSKEITEYLQGNNDFPEWMQNKLTGLHEKAKDMHAVMAGNYKESVDESLRKDIAAMAAKFPEGSKVKMKHDGKVAKVVSVGKDFVKVAVGNKTMDHKPSELEKVNEANRGSDSYRVKYKGDINTVRADSPEDALKKSMKTFGISSFNKSDYMKNASAISEDVISEAVNFHVRMDNLKDQDAKKVAAVLQKAEKSGSIKYSGESDKGISFSAKSKSDVATVTKDISKISRVADVQIMEAIEEKLEVSDGLEAWIKDFQASDAPQFKDQSKEEIRNMAIAAYLAAKKKEKGKK